jgi:hypothetical protein
MIETVTIIIGRQLHDVIIPMPEDKIGGTEQRIAQHKCDE